MRMYANEDLKKIIICFAGVSGLMEEILEKKPPKMKEAEKEVTEIKGLADKVLEVCEAGLDDDQIRGLLRYASNHTLSVTSKYNPRAEKDYYTVSQEALDRLLGDVMSDCSLCDKAGKQIKRCQRRRDLLECGIIPKGTEDCPYKLF